MEAHPPLVRPSSGRRIGATYRLQFHHAFTFQNAAAIVPYLKELGITHVYASPYLAAAPGSTHGYDVVDPSRLNPECGTDADYEAFVATLHAHGMGQIVDVVPNHMGVGSDLNRWWNSVLQLGRESPYAEYFDIAWNDPPAAEDRGKIVLPILGDELPVLVERDGLFFLQLGERHLPTAPGSVEHAAESIERVLERQHYRLVPWRQADERLNYRRFFNVNDLAGLRMERAEVFDDVHRWLIDHLASGDVDGVRIDHPDGLADPKTYFQHLQNARPNAQALYIVAEKILAIEESLDPAWPIDGTSGYDFLARVNAFLVNAYSRMAMSNIDQCFDGLRDFESVAVECKELMLRDSFQPEWTRLSRRMHRLLRERLGDQSPGLDQVCETLEQLIVHFPVYRTYLSDEPASPQDRRWIERAMTAAKQHQPSLDEVATRQIRDLLLRDGAFAGCGSCDCRRLRAVRGFQQLTAPIVAKGVEDTAMYRFSRLISLNEVGSDPDQFGLTAAALHDIFKDRQMHWPRAMSTLSTHDTKRSEDVRARISVLADMPDRWRDAVVSWSTRNAQLIKKHQQPAIDRGTEYFIYQTILGAWMPGMVEADAEFVDRIVAYFEKAAREAKRFTNWTDPSARYEESLHAFIRLILDRQKNAAFFESFLPFVQSLTRAGYINSLCQTTIKLLAPGIPDTYQGTELWDWSLVDPDNRRPVDYAARAELLTQVQSESLADLLHAPDDGRIKLWLTHRLLNWRRQLARDLTEWDYHPAALSGRHADSFFAYFRTTRDMEALIILPRFPGEWMAFTPTAPLQLPGHMLCDLRVAVADASAWTHLLTHQTQSASATGVLPLSDFLSVCPLAVLTRSN